MSFGQSFNVQFSRPALAWFWGRLVLTMAVGLWPWPQLAESFCNCMAFLGNCWLEQYGPGPSQAQFLSGELLQISALHQQAPWNAVVIAFTPNTGAFMQIPIDLRGLVYLPLLSILGLGIAVPLANWRRKLLVLGGGVLLIAGLSLVLLGLALLVMLSDVARVPVFSLSASAKTLIQVLHRALVSPPGMTYAVPFLVWLLLLYGTRTVASETSMRVARGVG